VTRVGDPERSRAAQALRRHYVEGRLTEEELADRVEVALAARTRGDLRASLFDMPRGLLELEALGFPAIRSGARLVRRALVLALAVGAWLVLSLALVIAFAVSVLAAGASTGVLVGFPLAWIVVTIAIVRFAGLRRPRRP